MANTIITIEIAEVLKAALVAVVPSAVAVYSVGIKDVIGATEDKVTFPCASISVAECNPNQYRSVLRVYPARVQMATWYPYDKDQIDLLTAAHAINQ